MMVTAAPHGHTPIFFMIKPDGVPHESAIMKMIEPLASVLARRPFEPVDRERIERQYRNQRKDTFHFQKPRTRRVAPAV